MQTHTIPEDDWIDYFDRFSADHLGWPVTIQVQDPQSGPHNIAQDLPLLGISFDSRGTRASSIEIITGDALDAHVEHVIDMPLNIREVEEPNGDIDIQIEPARGPIRLIHLSGPAH